jgi:plasmid stabilization system protein ParE
MGLDVYWTRFAENKLDDIFNYYETTVNISTAKKIVTGIINKTIDIENNLYIGQKELLLEKYEQEFRYLVYKNYKIIYWINFGNNRIEIANVFDTRQTPSKMDEIN